MVDGASPKEAWSDPSQPFASWWAALVDRWWLPVAGLALGVAVGVGLVVARPTRYDAFVLVAPADLFSPSGAPLDDYASSLLAIGRDVTSAGALEAAAALARIPVSELRGHVTTQGLDTGLGKVAGRGTLLVKITVGLPNPDAAEAAADELGRIAVEKLTSTYGTRSVGVIEQGIRGYQQQLSSLNPLQSDLRQALARPNLGPLMQILLSGQADSAAIQEDSLSAFLSAAQRQLSLARASEVPQLVGGRARAEKAIGLSPRNAGSIGGFAGLLVGGVVAIRRRRQP